MSDEQRIHLSTRSIPKASRFEFYMDVLQRSLWQVSGWDSLPRDFNVEMTGATLGGLTAVTQSISAHHSHRTRADVDRSAERNCHIFVTTGASWAFTHLGRHERLDAGDLVIIGEGEHETHAPEGFQGVIVKCSERWLQNWVPDHEAISGRRIRGDTSWGRILSLTLQSLSPDFCLAPPLPASVIVDQVGSALTLLADETEARAMPDLLRRARDCIRQRCPEPGLTSQAVATTLDVPTQLLHRALTSAKTSFATELAASRADVAWHLLQQHGASERSLMEIARRAGYAEVAQLARALRRRRADLAG